MFEGLIMQLLVYVFFSLLVLSCRGSLVCRSVLELFCSCPAEEMRHSINCFLKLLSCCLVVLYVRELPCGAATQIHVDTRSNSPE